MSFNPDQILLHYRLVEQIGEGGMGVVWRAVDTSLDREVAIKVLPDEVARDVERLARFEREARLLASLNHANIAAIYGLHEAEGLRFLAMELIPGEDLADLLARDKLPLDKSLRICLQVAEALEVAHENGIVHRDLKPANIRVTPDGLAKVLDFGLAKAFDSVGGSADPMQSPTITAAHTVAGTILGTAAYMSPEQASGQSADKRSDIWSLGVVLFEMLSGQRLFAGETISHTLADVLRADLDFGLIPADTPPSVQQLLERTLDRDPRRRLRDSGEVRVVLEDVLSGKNGIASGPTVAEAKSGARTIMPWAIAGILGIFGAAGWILHLSNSVPEEPKLVSRFTMEQPVSSVTRGGDGAQLAISPDGRTVIRSGDDGNGRTLYRRQLDSFAQKPLAGTSTALTPSYSPDGRWVTYFTPAGLYKINPRGGAPIKLADTAATDRCAQWDDKGNVFITSGGKIYRIPSEGGEKELVFETETRQDKVNNVRTIPGTNALFISGELSRGLDEALVILNMDDGSLIELGLQGSDARYLPTGHIIYHNGGKVLGVGFDRDRLEVTSPPMVLLEGVRIEGGNGVMHLAVSDNGTLVYLPRRAGQQDKLVFVERGGASTPVSEQALSEETVSDVRYSPDGSRVVFTESIHGAWILDVESGTVTPFAENSFYPLWSPDGSELIYGSSANANYDLFRRKADLRGPETLLLDQDINLRSSAWAPDGTLIFRVEVPGKGMDLMKWTDLEDESTIEVLLDGEFDELAPDISSDGRWMAYVSNQSGRDEIYVTAFPNPAGRVQISAQGGTSPAWSPDGKELFYMENSTMIAVSLRTEPTPRVLGRKELFEGQYLRYRWHRQFDVSPDGGRFLMVKSPASSNIEVIVNWFEEVKRLMGTNKQM